MRRVVVTGIGIVSPLGNTVDTLWNALMENRSGVRVMPEWREYFGKDCVNAPVSVTEDEIRSINRKIRRTMGNAALYACIASKEAVAQSTLDPEIFQSGRVGCVVGSTVGSASSMMEACAAEAAGQRDKLSSCHFFRLMSHSACFNLSEMYGINGIQLAPCSACASGLQSIGTAQEMIRLGKADVVLAGGTDESTTLVASSFQLLYALAENGAEHPETVAKPFDADRSGLVCGEGAGILVLEEYEHAVRRNADILFEIAGYATNCSGHHASRSDERQIAQCMGAALQDANIKADDVDYISAHATGTRVGDFAEQIAIKSIFSDTVPVSSLKGHLGHTLGASGAIELAAVYKSMKTGIIIPTKNLLRIDDCAGIWLPREPLERKVTVCIKNSIAFGGVNASLVCKRI